MKIVAAKSILKANDQLAAENRARFTREGLFTVNLVGSPGCGKTTLLEGLVQQFGARAATAVIEGDVAGQIDAEPHGKDRRAGRPDQYRRHVPSGRQHDLGGARRAERLRRGLPVHRKRRQSGLYRRF